VKIRNLAAAGALVLASATAGGVAVTVASSTPAAAAGSYAQQRIPEYRKLPAWARYQKLRTAECGRDHVAIVVYSTVHGGDSAALICRNGKVEGS
jgi:hypothetical protein